MFSHVLPDLRMVARVSGLASVGHLSFSVSSPSFSEFIAGSENGDVGFAPLQKSFALESKNG